MGFLARDKADIYSIVMIKDSNISDTGWSLPALAVN